MSELTVSSTRALKITPPFDGFYFIDLDRDKADYLQKLSAADAASDGSSTTTPMSICAIFCRRSGTSNTTAPSACSTLMDCISIGT